MAEEKENWKHKLGENYASHFRKPQILHESGKKRVFASFHAVASQGMSHKGIRLKSFKKNQPILEQWRNNTKKLEIEKKN